MQSRLTPLRFARSIFCTRSGHKRALCALRCGKCFANLGRLHYRLHIICFSFYMFSLFLIYSQYIGNSGIPYSPRTLHNDRSVSLMAAYITDTALHLHFMSIQFFSHSFKYLLIHSAVCQSTMCTICRNTIVICQIR